MTQLDEPTGVYVDSVCGTGWTCGFAVFASTMDIHCYSDVWAATNRCGNDSWTVVCCSNLTYLEPSLLQCGSDDLLCQINYIYLSVAQW